MEKLTISFLEKSNSRKASRVLSKAMLKNPLRVAAFQGKGEKQRREIEKMFFELINDLPGIIFLAWISKEIVSLMRMKSCDGRQI